jgi:hypothetical protein
MGQPMMSKTLDNDQVNGLIEGTDELLSLL